MKKILVFDTETTGLNPKVNEIAQIAWQVYSQEGDLQLEQNFYLDCQIGDSFIYHGISQNIINEFAIPHKEVFKYFFDSVKDVDMIVCHNYHYDSSMLKGTIEKRNLVKFALDLTNFLAKKHTCTMLSTTDFCKLPNPRFKTNYKFPKLEELHRILFKTEFEGAHNALCDVIATAKCYFALLQKGVITL
jgi:DNA polymerase III alpha subunit (gram-positive type)